MPQRDHPPSTRVSTPHELVLSVSPPCVSCLSRCRCMPCRLPAGMTTSLVVFCQNTRYISSVLFMTSSVLFMTSSCGVRFNGEPPNYLVTDLYHHIYVFTLLYHTHTQPPSWGLLRRGSSSDIKHGSRNRHGLPSPANQVSS